VKRPIVIAMLLVSTLLVLGQSGGKGKDKDGGKGGGKGPFQTLPNGDKDTFQTDIPAHDFDVLLARPTDRSMTVSLMFTADAEAFIQYDTKKTAVAKFKAGVPQHIALSNLTPNTAYTYSVAWKKAGGSCFTTGEPRTFHTARPPGSSFTFTLHADSHLDSGIDPAIYKQTLANALADHPDFHVELGDTFMTDKRGDWTTALPQYLAQRYYFGLLCHSAPLLFVIGNHDGETGAKPSSSRDSMPVWSNLTRKTYFANPTPGSFFTGNSTSHPLAGILEDYYAFTWGDALIIALDPYWFTTTRPRGDSDNWPVTLGKPQYDWLKQTLESSRAKYKFVFIHNLVGGLGKDGRGGAEAARYWEWGGLNAEDKDEFAAKRPGWAMPIHQLLVKHHVSAVFHGHDHIFAHQQLDGVTYQLVAQPSHPANRTDRTDRTANEYGYNSGTILSPPGHLRVTVTPDHATVDYVHSAPPASRDPIANGKTMHTYELKPYTAQPQ
jgi:hypothetical protein